MCACTCVNDMGYVEYVCMVYGEYGEYECMVSMSVW
jgi:hypothetical protein